VILTTQFMRSMPLPSTCVYPSFRGHCFASDGKLHDVNVLDLLIPEPGAFYIMDRGHLHKTGRFFVIRAKSNTKYRRRYSHPGGESGGVRCNRTIALSGVKSVRDYPQPLCRIRYHDV